MSVRPNDLEQIASTITVDKLDHRTVQARVMDKIWHPSHKFEPFLDEDVERSIPERFAKTVAAYPNHTALEQNSDSMTYAELNNAANVVARRLLDKPGTDSEPVGMLFDHGMEMVVALLGILKAGKFYVPLSPHDPTGRWEQVADVEPRTIIVDTDNAERLRGLPASNAELLLYDDLAFDVIEPDPDIQIAPDAYAYVLFTSGSTGVPKGVIGQHRNLLRFMKHIINQSRLCIHDRTAMMQSIAFSGSLAALFPTLFCGAAACFFDVHKQGLHNLADWFVEQKITYFIGGAIFRAMSEFLDEDCYFPDLRVIYGGGGPTYRRHFDIFKRVTSDTSIYVSSLSTTEASGISRMWLDHEYVPEGEILPAGYSDDDISVLLWDENGHPVAEGESGEIVVRMQYLSPGYWRRPELTAERFPADPDIPGQHVYRTGDLGRFDTDGCLIHMGRIDHQVKVRGNRVEIGEIESLLLNMEEIHDSVVHAIRNELGVELVAYVVGNGSPPNIQRIRQSLSKVLPDYAVPQRFVIMDALPRLLTGKVDYKSLPVPGRERPELTTPYMPASTQLEEQLVDIWAEVLDLDNVGVSDHFTDLGGDSLSAVRLLAALEELTGRRLPFAVIAEASTVRELADTLEKEVTNSSWQTVVRLQEGGERPPLFLVPPAGSTSIGFAQLVNYLGHDQPVYSFDPLGMNGDALPHTSVEEMAARYIQEMKQVQPEGPYYLGGRCFGSRPALEMAYQLEQAGDTVNRVFVIDSGLDPFQRPLLDGEMLKDKWIQRRQTASPAKILYRSMRFRSRKLYRSMLQSVSGQPTSGESADIDPVLQAHAQASRIYKPNSVQARIVILVSGQLVEQRHHLGWRQVAAGEIVEHYSDHWTHQSFLKDPDNLNQVSAILRSEMDAAQALTS